MTQYIARAYDGVRWVAHLETDNIDTALAQARGLMDLIARTPGTSDTTDARTVPPWLLVEVAETDARAWIVRQWVGSPDGYRQVAGRCDRTYESLPGHMLR